ncbi:MAG: entericidin [Pseudomonadota bacterium]
MPKMFVTCKSALLISALVMTSITVSGCANTIRGVGKDASNTVDATQGAVRRTGRAVAN